MTGLIIFGSLLIGMFMGLPVCFALLAACLIYLIPSGIPLTIVPQTMIAGMNSFVLLAIPLFRDLGIFHEYGHRYFNAFHFLGKRNKLSLLRQLPFRKRNRSTRFV